MIPTLKEIIRSKSREGWSEFLREKVTDARIWIQENGEKAALVTFVVGLTAALLFKLFIFLIVAAVLFGYSVWYVAIPEKRFDGEGKTGESSRENKASTDRSFNMTTPEDSSKDHSPH